MTSDTFKYVIIKPNINADKNRSDYFNDNLYELLHHDTTKPPIETEQGKSGLVDFLKTRDYISIETATTETICIKFENFVNPNNITDHDYDTKTILENDDIIYMIQYDHSFMKNHSLFNHLATYLTVDNEPIFGPVFLFKINKTICNDKIIATHANTTLDDVSELLLGTKQVYCWNFTKNVGWKPYLIYNSNSDLSKTHKLYNMGKSLIFYKILDELDMNEIEIKEHLITNITNNDELEKVFENIKICRLRYGDLENNETIELADHHVQVAEVAAKSFTEYDKCRVVMESMFQDINTEKFQI